MDQENPSAAFTDSMAMVLRQSPVPNTWGLMSRVVLPGTPTLKELPVMPIKPLGFLRRNVKTKMPRITETNYSTLVRLQLEYALAVWDSHAKDKINQIEWCSAGLPDGLASIIDIDIEALFNVKNVQQITYAL